MICRLSKWEKAYDNTEKAWKQVSSSVGSINSLVPNFSLNKNAANPVWIRVARVYNEEE